MHRLKVFSCNRNGDHRRNRTCISKLIKHHHITCLQESSFPSRHAFDKFCAQASSEFKNSIFVNDSGATSSTRVQGKRGGVCTILHADLHGVDSAVHVADLDVQDRYLVVRLQWGETAVYIHNVYAPVDPHARAQFFDSLPRSFASDDIHVICGDLNTPITLDLDALSPLSIHRPSHHAALQWMWDLEVVDAWRIHNPNETVYTGPGRVNRLDYILVSQSLQEQTTMPRTTWTHAFEA